MDGGRDLNRKGATLKYAALAVLALSAGIAAAMLFPGVTGKLRDFGRRIFKTL